MGSLRATTFVRVINVLQLRFFADRPHHLFDRVNDYVGSVDDDEMTSVLCDELLAVT